MRDEKRFPPRRKAGGIRVVVFIVCIFSAVISAFFLTTANGALRSETGRAMPISLPLEAPVPPRPSSAPLPPTPTIEPSSEPVILEQFIELYEQNPDTIGWIRIPETAVDYPVLQSPASDWDFYLNRNFYREYDIHGIPYIWPQHDILEDDLIFIFGHNMRDGTRFADVISYMDYDFFREHPIIEFSTLYEEGRYEVAFVFQVFVIADVNQYYYHPERGTTDRIEFPYTFITAWSGKEAFWNFIEQNREHALYDTGVEVEYGDRMIALWTCTSGAYRLVVVAVER